MSKEAQLVWFTRVGFAARGVLYLIIAYLLIATGRSTDMSSALDYMFANDKGMLLVIIAGFVAYGIWRLSDAALDSEGRGDDAKGIAGRLGAAGSGIIYLFLAYRGYKLISGSGGGSSDGTQQQASTVMELPGGWILIGIGAVILLAAGIWQLARAYSCSFLKHLTGTVQQQDWVRWLGRIGYSARGFIFIVTAFFFGQAALSGRANEAGGMEEALQWLDSPVNIIVAVGLALFGLFSLVEARYRAITPPHVDKFS